MKRLYGTMYFGLLLLPLLAGAGQAARAEGTSAANPVPAGGYTASAPCDNSRDTLFDCLARRGQAFADCPQGASQAAYAPAPAPDSGWSGKKSKGTSSKRSASKKKTASKPAPALEPLFGPDPICPPGCVPAAKVSSAGTAERAYPKLTGTPASNTAPVVLPPPARTAPQTLVPATPPPAAPSLMPAAPASPPSEPVSTMQEQPAPAYQAQPPAMPVPATDAGAPVPMVMPGTADASSTAHMPGTGADQPLAATPRPVPADAAQPAAPATRPLPEPAPIPAVGLPAPSAAQLGQFPSNAAPMGTVSPTTP